MSNIIYLEAGITMAQAGSNALMGILIVLFSLAFIAIVINMFNIVNKSRNAKTVDVPVVSEPAALSVVEDEADDTELIAVLMAAIVSYEAELGNNVSPEDLVVRSVKKLRRR